MKRLMTSSLIALFLSTGALAQQASEEAEKTVDGMAQNAEAATNDAVNTVEAASDDLATDAQAMDSEVAADRQILRSPTNMTRDGYIPVDPVELTAEELTGARVYGVDDEAIGEIGELLLSAEGGAIDQVVVDVGGFLGLGEHEVAVTMEELHIMRSDDGSDVRVYMDATQEELEAQPEYEG